jgi:FAD:protein FMN transferase
MRRVEHVMGFPVSLRVDDEGFGESAVDGLFAWLREVDARFSPFREDSEVSRLDRGELAPDRLSTDLTEILALCERYRTATGGAFDVRLPAGASTRARW